MPGGGGKLKEWVNHQMKNWQRMILKLASSPRIDMKRDYKLARMLQQAVSPEINKPFQVIDKVIRFDDSDYSIPVRAFFPDDERKPGALIFFHGGGWVIGDIGSYTPACVELANETGMAVFSVDYRLAPENPYPSGLYDCFYATAALMENLDWIGVEEGDDIVLIGDSAGGNLAAVVSMMLRDRGRPLPKKQILLYPATYWDHSEESPYASVRENGNDFGLTMKKLNEYMELYVPDPEMRKDPYISPLMAKDMQGLPDTLIITAELDPLRDEGEAYGEALRAAGSRVRIVRIHDAVHGFMTHPKLDDSLEQAYGEIRKFLGING